MSENGWKEFHLDRATQAASAMYLPRRRRKVVDPAEFSTVLIGLFFSLLGILPFLLMVLADMGVGRLDMVAPGRLVVAPHPIYRFIGGF